MPKGRSPLRLPALLLGLGACLLLPATAGAQGVGSATPNTPNVATKLHWDVDGTAAPVSSRIPSSLVMTAQPGFTLNMAAAPKRCTRTKAELDECPKLSRIGSGEMVIHVEKPSGPNDLGVPIKLYRAKGQGILAIAFLAGNRVVPGKLDGSNGVTLTFDPLPSPPPIPKVSYAFMRVTVDLGVSRKVPVKTRKVSKKSRKHRRKRAKVKMVRADLIRSPSTCAGGTWAASVTLGFPDATNALVNAPMACTA
jgi:hypothetical protein